MVGLWITLGVKLEIEPISEADPVLILEKSEKKKIYKKFNTIHQTHINSLHFVDCLFFYKKWYFVTIIVLTYCEKKLF